VDLELHETVKKKVAGTPCRTWCSESLLRWHRIPTERNDLAWRRTIDCPRPHQLPAFLKEITTTIRGLDLGTDGMDYDVPSGTLLRVGENTR